MNHARIVDNMYCAVQGVEESLRAHQTNREMIKERTTMGTEKRLVYLVFHTGTLYKGTRHLFGSVALLPPHSDNQPP